MEQADTGVVDSRALRPGMVIGGKFALLQKLGEGGVGVVFEAEDLWIGRRVALKMLHSHLLSQADILARFRREARAAAMTNHPNIVGVFEVGQWHDGQPFIVQELLHGETLRDRLVRTGRFTPAEAIEVLVPMMGALAVAHRAGIVHRDVKPENIFLARGGEGSPPMVPKIIDFGIAKISSSEMTTLTGSLVGTPMYMSPEQASGASPADHRTDIWALGAVMYEMLSDHCPFEGVSAAVVLAKILTEEPKPIVRWVKNIPPELAALVHRALARDRAARFGSVDEMLEALLLYAAKPDPTVAARHARSIPPPPSSVEPVSIPVEATPNPTLISAISGSPSPAERERGLGGEGPRAAPEWRRPLVQPELGWYDARPGARTRKDLDGYVAAAGQALGDNALDEAVEHAEHAVIVGGATGTVLGQMRLVQAIALRWLGHYADAERCALEAVDRLQPRGPAWYTALGHVAMLGGYLGKNDSFPGILARLGEIEAEGPVRAQHVIAVCRLAVSLVRAGLVERASRALASARAAAEAGTEDEPMVRAWIFVAAAEFAMHEGDPAGYLQHLEAALLCFAESGDARNACLQRANIGNGYMQLGAYARAKGVLKEALAVGEPMRLGFIAAVRANLGFVMARLGDPEQALEIETAALEQCIREGYRRFELASRIYLATVLAMRGEAPRAEAELRAAAEGSASAPAIQAYALANLADILFSQERSAEAASWAKEAMSILRRLEGIEEGESLVRLQHALALAAEGDEAGAANAVGEARRRLLDRADRINDPRLRRSFLDHIPENARTLALASRYKPAR